MNTIFTTDDPENYVDNIWIRDRKGMKELRPIKVFEAIIKDL